MVHDELVKGFETKNEAHAVEHVVAREEVCQCVVVEFHDASCCLVLGMVLEVENNFLEAVSNVAQELR